MSGDGSPPRLTLYYRPDCHLCEDMHLQLQTMQKHRPFGLVAADVNSDPELERRYGLLLPALVSEQGIVCHYYLDPVAVNKYLDSAV